MNMRVLALDPATCTGFAFGDGSGIPESGSVRLRYGEDSEPDDIAAGMAAFLLRQIRAYKPDLIIVEAYLPPGTQMHQAPVISSLLLHGAIAAMCGLYRISLTTCTAAQFRKHFVGRSTAKPRSKGARTAKAKAEDRRANKQIVIDRAKLLRWLPESCNDDNRADALAIWSYGIGMYSKYDPANPPKLEMYRD